MIDDDHITREQADAYCCIRSGPNALTPSQQLVLSEHAAVCARCRELLAKTARASGKDSRAGWFAEIHGLAAEVKAESARESADLRDFTTFVQSFPPETFYPGGTSPKRFRSTSSKRKKTAAKADFGIVSSWLALVFSRPAFVVSGVAALSLAALVAASAIFNNTSTRTAAGIASEATLLKDGPIRVSADGKIQTNANFPADLQATIFDALSRHSLPFPESLTEKFRGGDDTAAAKAPVDVLAPIPPYPLLPASGTTVESQFPVLQWKKVPGASGCQIEITSVSTGERILSPLLEASQTRWQPTTSLERGRIYRWRVLPGGIDKTNQDRNVHNSSTVSLKVLSAVEAAYLQHLRGGPNSSHLAVAVACARLNLIAEAKTELQALKAQNIDSTLVTQLLHSCDVAAR